MGRVNRFLFAVLFAGLFACLFACFQSCKQKEYVTIDHIRTDSTFRQVTDTVVIRMRIADFSYILPSVSMERETKDTISVLSDSLYRSVARVSGGVLYHSLATIQGARVTVSANVADTTKSKTTDTYSGMTEVKSVPVYVEKEMSAWDRIRLKAFYPLVVVGLLALGFVVYKVVK